MDVGIIGGQDGPTVILTSGSPVTLIVLLVLTVALIGGVIWLFRRKRKK